MSTAIVTVGNQSDADPRDSAQLTHILRPELRTLQELLTAIEQLRPSLPVAMLRTTAAHVSNLLSTPVQQVAIAALVDLGPRLRNYLRERRYKVGSVRSYSNFLAILLRTAKELGWQAQQPDVAKEWTPFLAVIKPRSGCSGIVRYAVRLGKLPSQFCEDDLNAWERTLLNQGRSCAYTAAVKGRFRRALLTNGLAAALTGISYTSRKPSSYGVPLRFFPTQLRNEVTTLLKWKQDLYAEGRPLLARHRAISAKTLENCITRLYGYVTKVENRENVTSLVQLVTKRSVSTFIAWSINERKVKSGPFVGCLGLLCAAMRWNPAYKDLDFSWFRTLLSQVSPDPESERRERKALKYLPYDTLADIPRMIHGRREEVAKVGRKQLAFLVHDELLLYWLATLVWRQRNVRECRIGTNLFKAELPPLANIARPQWVEERLAVNPHDQFWQFYFREDETKTGHVVRSILQRRLVPLLEEYLQQHRSLLFRGSDRGTLFLNRADGPLTQHQVNDLVSTLTMRYKRRRVTPHLFRDIFAYWWLEHHPEDYLTLSKMLWHRDIKTTLRIYGGKFDESNGLRRVEEWLDRRVEGAEHITEEAAESASELRPSATENYTADYKMEYEQQRKIAERLMDRIEQLEKQLSHRTLEPHTELSQLQPKIQPGKLKSLFRKTGSGAA